MSLKNESIVEPNKIKIGILENDDFFLEELKNRISELDNVSEIFFWKTGEMLLRDPKHKNIDILFLDIMLPGISGIEVVKNLSEKNENVKVIMLTNMNSDEMIFNSIKNGALGYLLKSELGQIKNIVEVLLGGGAYITPTIALRVFSSFRRPIDRPKVYLTDREKQILELLVKGKTIPLVSKFLDLSEHTVQGYVKSIYRKLQVHNRSELALKVQEYSIL
ncbi:response regulator transcription factor [Leptospira bandrabouensis]|uniref:response regulator transcription factor n=1 Tax=Leptospira bandrabouensis TaxID=2484903 RepID=UPI001EE9AB25|nr:response regulator transcription factor [Leptospira bandrabouensis]MCG6145573.1 response regulator transcription factor [Leptospira bandrabouensis]MCG6160887.1 response regulator transcription factor [Leptospira bandrabouensis]MCG6165425.1 response regulator transcription factor [Leptospira bandrabouensis]MCW7460206.1 response regulator transcription factor [Leptospira bandrabouensis]MCW7478357.1 response regulator transcription factor [Leptospira bandrabouensis]